MIYYVPIGLYEANLPTNTNVNKYTLYCYCEGRLSLMLIWAWSVSNVKIHIRHTKLFLENKYLIIRGKSFHKRL